MATGNLRLDRLLVERGLADSRQHAQGLILSGAVVVDGAVVLKSGSLIPADVQIQVSRLDAEFASRGGHKLAAAFDAFELNVSGRVAVDVGSSTGGFTDVLLRRGSARVYSIDVGYGQLAWRLRNDPKVVVMERTNFRYVESLPESPSVATVDVSFISLRLILPRLVTVVAQGCDAIVLIKPQFEAGRERVGKGGVVRDPDVHRDVLRSILGECTEIGWGVRGVILSPLVGPAGNREFLAHLIAGGSSIDSVEEAVDRTLYRDPSGHGAPPGI